MTDQEEYLKECEDDIIYLRELFKGLSNREKEEAEKIIALVEKTKTEVKKQEMFKENNMAER